MKRKSIKVPGKRVGHEALDRLVEAAALVLARRQMKRYWAPVHRTTSGAMV